MGVSGIGMHVLDEIGVLAATCNANDARNLTRARVCARRTPPPLSPCAGIGGLARF